MSDLEMQINNWLNKNTGTENDPEMKRKFQTDNGLTINSLYTPLDLKKRQFDYQKDLGLPGEFPFTRGIYPHMFRQEAPLVKVYSGYGLPAHSNKRYKKLIEWGADEIQIAVDLPTQVGYDSDHIMACGEVGKVGVAIDSLQDMEILFEGIPLNSIKRVSMLGNSFGPVALALFIALGEKQGLKPEEYVVDLQNDILKEYVARGTQIYPIRPSIKMVCDVVEYCAKFHPHWYPLTCCVNHINAAGAGSSKGTAFALANALCYIEDLLGRGLSIDQFGSFMDMFLDERDDFFVTIANLRATRRVWAHLMRDKFKAQKPETMALKVTAYSHGRETLLEPINNIARIGFAALAYFFGGVQYLYDASYDESTNTPSDDSVKVAIRTLQIISNEFGISSTIDPLGGSYYLESLTCDIEQQILAELEKVQSLGGAVEAIETGHYRKAITEGAVRRQKRFETGERISVGVNKFVSKDPLPEATFRPNPDTELEQIINLKRLRSSRNQSRIQETLQHIREQAVSGKNLVQSILEAVRSYATIGEICDTLRAVYGEYDSREVF